MPGHQTTQARFNRQLPNWDLLGVTDHEEWLSDSLPETDTQPLSAQLPTVQTLSGTVISMTEGDLDTLQQDKGLGDSFTEEEAEFVLPAVPEGRGLADCGQHAAGVAGGNYLVGSVPTASQGGVPQALGDIHPASFPFQHALTFDQFLSSTIPPQAQGVAFLDPDTQGFHYARLFPDGTLSQTDANSFGLLDSRFEEGIRATMAVTHLTCIEAFARYCETIYTPNSGQYYYVYFRP